MEDWHPNDAIAPDFWGYGEDDPNADDGWEDEASPKIASRTLATPVAEADVSPLNMGSVSAPRVPSVRPLPQQLPHVLLAATAACSALTTASLQAPAPVASSEGFRLWWIHRALSHVTNKRAKILPFEGTLDFWVLLVITVVEIASVIAGFAYAANGTRYFTNADKAKDAYKGGSLFRLRGDPEINLRLIATVRSQAPSRDAVARRSRA